MSGETLSKQFGITRSAVWKHIVGLKEEGYQIDSVRNRGYRLLSAPDRLDAGAILQQIPSAAVGTGLKVMQTVDSTNEEMKRLARKGAENGLIVAAECQTAGKGRFCRTWSSEMDGGLYFSLLLRPELPPADIASITLAAGFGVCLAVRNFTGIDARIKWPNDVIVGKKKICGILTEMAAQSDRIDYVVIGIGINVNKEQFPEEIADRATSLMLETGKRIDRNAFFACVIRYLDRVIGDFLVSLSLSDVEQFKNLCATMGRVVSVQRGNQTLSGTACDISPLGELVVRMEDGGELVINSGEVTVQGIY